MPNIYTPPDLHPDPRAPRILIRNCPWTEDQLRGYIEHLSDLDYGIYIYNDSMNDYLWCEGVRTSSRKVIDYRDFKDRDPVEFLKSLDEIFKPKE